MAQGDGLTALPEEPKDMDPRETVSVSAGFVSAANRLAEEVEELLPGQNKQTQIRLLSALGAFWKSR